MAKSRNQKGKILVLEHLLVGTSESHIVTMQEILDKLMEYGITAERKSIYDDIEALREFGLDVQYKRGRPGGYYLAEGSETVAAAVSIHPKEAQAESGDSEEIQKKETGKKVTEKEKPQKPVIVSIEQTLDKEEIQDTEKAMKLQCKASREKEIREYFGSYGEYKVKDSGYLQVTAPQVAGPKFYGWLAMMGKDIHILKPKKAAASYRDYLKALAKEYKGI